MNRRLVLGIVLALAALASAIVLLRHEGEAPAPASSATSTAQPLDPVVEEFRRVERAAIATYNAALRDQRENRIDELELANVIERDVLAPWRALRERVEAATPAPDSADLYRLLRAYIEARQVAWEAYVAALRAPTDEAARPHYDMHRQKNAEAHEIARSLGDRFRAVNGDPRSP